MTDFFQNFMNVVATGDQSEIDKQFLHNMRSKRTLDEIKFMIDNGANPRYDDDTAFLLACTMSDTNILLYFISDCNVNINTLSGFALEQAIWSESIDNVKLLLENGIKVTDRAIQRVATQDNSVELLKILMNYVDQQRVIECISKKICYSLLASYQDIIKFLVQNGTDYGTIFNRLLK